MDLCPDDTQQEIVNQTSAFLEKKLPLARLRSGDSAVGRISDALWSEIVGLGWLSLGLDEESGGVGFTIAEEVLVMREIGRRAVSISLVATVMAVHVAKSAAHKALMASLLAGEKRVGWLEGRQVFEGESADLWLSIDNQCACLFDGQSMSSISSPCIDEFTELAIAEVNEAGLIAKVDHSHREFNHAAILVAAQLVGLAEAARDLAASYASERVQFGRPIGVFQGVKHPCADMAVRCEAAWSQTVYAALALRDGYPNASRQVSAAKATAGDAANRNAAACVQVFGGIGVTTECDAHVLVKRAQVLRRLAGKDRFHLRRLLDETG